VPDAEPELTAREQILDAAAALFAEHGVAATSTRAIADRVGVRQASLYYHFAGKDDILVELLTTSVRPSLQVVARIEALVPDRAGPAGALYALAVVDVDTLVRTPHNIATLYLLPELQGERYDAFRAERRELQDAYGRLAAATAVDGVAATVGEDRLGAVLIQLVEVVIQLRRTGEVHPADAAAIASSCLRVCGLDATAITAARAEAGELAADAGATVTRS
jgi:AcrR family transcriptional regulator